MKDLVCHAKELEIYFIGGRIEPELCLGKDDSGIIVHGSTEERKG